MDPRVNSVQFGSKSGKYLLNFMKICPNIVSSKPEKKTAKKKRPIEILQGFDTL